MSSFGIGTDFICRVEKVNSSLVHVIQSFFSSTFSEEKQIRGRTARMGNSGSYSLVVLKHDLDSELIKKIDSKNSSDIYRIMNEVRDQSRIDFYKELLSKKEDEDKINKDPKTIIQNYKSNELPKLKKSLLELNKNNQKIL